MFFLALLSRFNRRKQTHFGTMFPFYFCIRRQPRAQRRGQVRARLCLLKPLQRLNCLWHWSVFHFKLFGAE